MSRRAWRSLLSQSNAVVGAVAERQLLANEGSRMEREFDISCGVDVGKWSHHFTAIDRRTGEVLLDAKIGQDEREIRDALGELMRVGRTMVVVDQPGSMSALLFAIADDMYSGPTFLDS